MNRLIQRMVIGCLIGLALMSAPQIWAQTDSSSQTSRTDRRVLIVSIDGLRPDVALRADMPVLRRIMKQGSYTFWAVTTDVAITLPSHVSMLTGVPPQLHQITWNTDLVPENSPEAPAYPTLFELAKQSGYTTAVVAGKSKFKILLKPGTVDWSFVASAMDTQVADQAIGIIERSSPQVLFVHFPFTDAAGHRYGWGADLQLEAIENADKQLGRVLAALDQAKLLEKTLVIVTADHGGSGFSHGGLDPRSRHIPWVAMGPGVNANYDMNRRTDVAVRIEDTFATACDYLGLTLERAVQGKPVKAMFEPVPAIRK